MQPYCIEVVVPAPTNSVRSHDHPILESGSLSFPEGRYVLEFVPGHDCSSYVITHRIEGAALIQRLVEAGKAGFVCVVSSPKSSYRRTHVSAFPRQDVSWNGDDLGEGPLFTPMVVCSDEHEIILDSKRDGVHAIWDGQRVGFHKGSRLALGRVVHLVESSITHLLSLDEAKDLPDGRFAVDVETEPFRFRVKVAANLHRFLRHRVDENYVNIMTHIVTACLARLQREYPNEDGDSGWTSHRNLKAFADELEKKGVKHWTDDDFRPEEAATALYPHVLPKSSQGGDAGEGG